MSLIAKNTVVLLALLAFGGFHPSPAQPQETFPSPGPTASFPPPLHLKASLAIPDDALFPKPAVPAKDAYGVPLETTDSAQLPSGEVMDDLTDPSILAQILKLNHAESAKNRYQWHASRVWRYCHFRNQDGNHWYGWKTGPQFHWLLFKNGLYWWRDSQAGRWLYFHQGYWWWPDKQNKGKYQVYQKDGHYYLCDAHGVLGSDTGPRGGTISGIPVPLQTPSGPGNSRKPHNPK
jgi:hypothetical protein